jgi:hypothetical protein
VASGNVDNVKYICDKFPSAVNIENFQKSNPLHVACEGESLPILQLLHNAFPSNVYKTDSEGRYPLHIFMQVHPDISPETSPEADCLRFLLKENSDAVDSEDSHHESPLSICPTDNLFVRRLLLRAKPGINPTELHDLNYQQRRMGVFLAYCAINADGIPNIFSQLRDRDHLLELALSYL